MFMKQLRPNKNGRESNIGYWGRGIANWVYGNQSMYCRICLILKILQPDIGISVIQ